MKPRSIGAALFLHAVVVVAGIAIAKFNVATTSFVLVVCGLAGAALSLAFLSRSRRSTSEGLSRLLTQFGDVDSYGSNQRTPESQLTELTKRADEIRATATRMEADRERLATILSSMTEGVIAIDRDERIVLANEASYAAMDGDAEKPIGRPLRELVRSVQIHDYVRAVLSGESPEPIECEFARSQRIVTVKADLIGDEKPKGAVLTIFDITDLRRLERIRREFVANASHELKTPLTVIQACSDTLLNGAMEDPVAAKKFLTRIDEQCGRLGELINDMLDLGRIEASQESLEIQTVDLAEVLRECVQQRESIAHANQLSLRVEMPGPSLTIESDPTSIRTLVSNLADNAIKYTAAGGSVTLELEAHDDAAVIRVRDTGIGIDREHINRIFQRFYRVDSARSRASGGSGLGLAIVKHLTQQLGGTIAVESEPAVGSTFIVTLPLSQSNAETARL